MRWDPEETLLGMNGSLIKGVLTLSCVPGLRVEVAVPWKGQWFVPSGEARLRSTHEGHMYRESGTSCNATG